ncbi:MAG: inositol monophosphatase family protein [Actinomycetota bacterium]
MDAEAFALGLARRIAEAVAPLFGHPDARRYAGTAPGGDTTYGIDEVAERVAEEAFGRLGDVAYFTEDGGLVVRGRPDVLFLVDPIDGTRPSTAGFETCCVTLAVGPYGSDVTDVTLGDLTYGCIVEITTGAEFEARRGGGATARGRQLSPSDHKGLDGLFWAGGFRGQPAVALSAVLAGIFDVAGARGAFFDQGSATYSLSRVATGQLDAMVDPGAWLVEEIPELEELFRLVGGGHVLNTTTYDVAAGLLLLWELGCPATSPTGAALEEVPLLDGEGKASAVPSVSASTPELHGALLEALGEGMDRLRGLVAAVGVEALVG